jgi:tRNA-splicing ligase RtcB
MAFANRQVIYHQIRKCFGNIFGKTPQDLGLHQIYDVTHNTAKLEKHDVDGKKKELLVHRKGSTRAFPPGHPDLEKDFQETGQPIIIGGSMVTGSYLLVGTEEAMKKSWGSTAHGSGRTMSRHQAKKMVKGRDLAEEMEQKGILVKAASHSGLAEEAGFAYKNISDVVEACELSGISKKVVAFEPIGNIKG